MNTLTRLLPLLILIATLEAPRVTSAQNNLAKEKPKMDARPKVQWKVGNPLSYPNIETPILPGPQIRLYSQETGKFVELSVTHTGTNRAMEASIAASAKEKLVVIPISWSLGQGVKDSGGVRIGNLLFSAVRQGSQTQRGVAILLGPPKAQDMWHIPERGSGLEFDVDVQFFPAYTIAVAFLVPSGWEDFDVRLDDKSIGVARVSELGKAK